MVATDPEAIFAGHRERFIEMLRPLFLPADPISHDIVRYFASLLRVLGMEDRGWDPYAESRSILNDLNTLMTVELPANKFTEPEATIWRLGLLLYSHVVEMDAPYEVIVNLLRFRLGRGYSPNPYFDFLTEKQRKGFKRSGIRTGQKIEIIQSLSREAGLLVGDLYLEFYDNRLRNAVQHSDFILTDSGLRSRNGISGIDAFEISYEELNALITKAKAFIAAYFQVELLARQVWGTRKGEAIPYDPLYKGLLEILVDENDLLCGFAVHWPNNSQSTYRRTADGVEMVNCSLDVKLATISLFVDRYAIQPGTFSPLVEFDSAPLYTPLDKSTARPSWPAQ
jgi:hypothetical protein